MAARSSTTVILAALSLKALSVQRLPDRTGVAVLVGQVAPVHVGAAGALKVFADGALWEARSAVPLNDGQLVEITGSRRPDRPRQALRTERKSMNMPNPIFIAGIFVVIFFLSKWVNILNEYERAVTFWLGRLGPAPKGPGLTFIFWPFETMVRVDLRTITLDVPPQDVITRDNVSVKVNAVVYFHVMDPAKAIVKVANYMYATSQLAQTTLRSVLGQAMLDGLLSEREKLNESLQEILDQHTDPWGIKVTMVEVKAVDLPIEMQRAMAKQAEAEREKRAKIIHASGEFEASKQLAEAAHVIATEPASMQLRYLQTLTEIAAEKNSTILFPVPIEMLALLGMKLQKAGRAEELGEK